MKEQDLKHGAIVMLHSSSSTAKREEHKPDPFIVIGEGKEAKLYHMRNGGALWSLNNHLPNLTIVSNEEREVLVKWFEEKSERKHFDKLIKDIEDKYNTMSEMVVLLKNTGNVKNPFSFL